MQNGGNVKNSIISWIDFVGYISTLYFCDKVKGKSKQLFVNRMVLQAKHTKQMKLNNA